MANKLASKPIATLKGHTSAVNALTFSGGAGTYLLSGSSDRTIRLWNPSSSTSTAVQTYSGVHGHEVLAIAVSSDNSRFASAGAERTVFLWDVASARTTRRFGGGAGGHGARVEAVAFAGDGDGVLASGGVDGSVRLWDCRSQNAQPIMVLGEARDAVSCVGVCDAEVFAGSVDGRVRCYDVRMGVLRVDVVGKPVVSVTPSAQGETMLVSSLDSTIRSFDAATGRTLRAYSDKRFELATYRIRSTLACKDAVVLSGAEDGHAYAWDAVTGALLMRVPHGELAAESRPSRRVVGAVACKRRGHEWASAGGDGTVVVWG